MSAAAIWAAGGVILVLAGVVALITLLRIRLRQRVFRLDWPERFHDWKTLCWYCKVFLRRNGWQVLACMVADADLIVTRRPQSIVLNVLTEADHWDKVAEHFMNRSMKAIKSRKRPVALVTDFKLPEELIQRCHLHQIYPLYYKELPDLHQKVPSTREFRDLRPELRR